MSRYPASTVAPFTLLVPVIGILTAWLVQGEHPTGGELLGSFIALIGLGLALGVVDALAVRRRSTRAQRGVPDRVTVRGSADEPVRRTDAPRPPEKSP
jgi:O-acetylserine/cysteine efflux transporter